MTGAYRLRFALANAAIAMTLLLTMLQFRAGNAFDTWSLAQQDINRDLLAGIRSLAPEVQRAHSVLIVGVAVPFHPWEHPGFLSRDLGFTGHWSLTVEPGGVYSSPAVQTVRYDEIRWTDYDLIVIFRSDGSVVGSYRPEQLAARAASHGRTMSPQGDVRRIETYHSGERNAPAASSAPANAPTLPTGVVATAPVRGIFPGSGESDVSCCWVGPQASFLVRLRPHARSLAVTVYQPAIEKLAGTPQIMTLLDSKGRMLGSQRVTDGLTTERFPLPTNRGDEAAVTLRFSRSFIPNEVGLGGDPRRLTVILRNVTVR